MEVAIIDDEEKMSEIICKYILNNELNIICECNVFQKGEYLLNKMKSGRKYDLYLVDIEMPEKNGLELAKEIRDIQKNAYIVFITSYAKYALRSYDLKINAYQYIMKKDMQEKLLEVIASISHEIEEQKDNYYIIQNKQRYEKLKIRSMIYIYKENKNSVFVTDEGIYKERKALKDVLKDINNEDFIFIDSGRIINIRLVRRIAKNSIVFMSGTELYASDISIRKVKKNINAYWRKHL